MHPSENRILVIDDNPAIHGDYQKVLSPPAGFNHGLHELESIVLGTAAQPAGESTIHFQMESALSGQEGLEMVKQSLVENRPYSTAFVDMRMGRGWDGIETIKQLWAVYPDVQIVICTAHSDYSWNDIVRALGKTDKLVILRKPFDNVEVLQLALALSKKWLATLQARAQMQALDSLVAERTAELERANMRLRLEVNAKAEAEERFTRAFHATPLAMAIVNAQTLRWADSNEAFTELSGASHMELLANVIPVNSFWADQPESLCQLLHAPHSLRGEECEFKTVDGQQRKVLLSREFFHCSGMPHILLILHDVTEQRLAEGQMREAVKLEAIGRLAASVAHDFNNVLTVVQGNAGMLLSNDLLAEACRPEVQQIADAAMRATSLVRQLTSLGRKKVIAPRPVNIAEQVEMQARMLARLIGEQNQVKWDCAPHTPNAMVDPGTLDQILLNLVINARDAMEQGGIITISTRMVDVDEEHAARVPNARADRFVLMQVADTGSGMDPALKNRIFEPFFSTKELGAGTGLGLATVYSLVREQHGWVEVESIVDSGSTFSVYLPATDERAVEAPARIATPYETNATAVGRGRSALVVEDDQSIRCVLKQLLRRNGFQVLEASSGQQALTLWRERQNEIALVITDLVMPGMVNGLDVGRRVSLEKPKVKMVYSSGYNIDMLEEGHGLEEGRNYLPKPYDDAQLSQFLRNIFAAPPATQTVAH